MAVLRVEESLDIPLLKLCISGEIGRPFSTAGFYSFGKSVLVQKLKGVLDRQTVSLSRNLKNRSAAWFIEIKDDQLERGYSGAPVVDENGKVLGVISTRLGKGERGLAISIEALKKIWNDMPDGLIEGLEMPEPIPAFQHIPDPLMNFEKELAAFKKIATNQDNQTRLILVRGDGGMGKSRLLKEYDRVACENNLTVLPISLGPQITIEKCLNDIIYRFGIKHYVSYTQFRKAGRPEPLTRAREEEWHNNLTFEFFADHSNNPHAPRLAIFFDQYEKADPAFKKWLSHTFLPGLFSHPLIVVIAGREDIEQKPSWVSAIFP